MSEIAIEKQSNNNAKIPEEDITKNNESNKSNEIIKGNDIVLEAETRCTLITPKRKGNPLWMKGVTGNPNGRPKKKPFSLREDLIESLKRIKKREPLKYQAIIDSYWNDPKMRSFLFEQVDGKARQSVELSGTLENPVRVVEVIAMTQIPADANLAKQALSKSVSDS